MKVKINIVNINKIMNIYDPYYELIDKLDIFLDQIVDLLNDLKLENPNKEINIDYKTRYGVILNNNFNILNKLEIKEKIILIKNNNDVFGIKINKFKPINVNKYIFNNQEYIIDKLNGLNELNDELNNYDFVILLRNNLLILQKLLNEIIEYKQYFINLTK